MNKISQVKKTKYLIIGSGLSTYFFLLGVQKKYRKKFLVLNGDNENVNPNELKYDNNLDFERANYFGGLGNQWLGGSSIFDKNELRQNNFINNLPIFQKKILKKFKLDSNEKYKKIKSNLRENFFYNNPNLKLNYPFILRDLKHKKKILRPKKFNEVNYLNYRLINFKKKGKDFVCYCSNKKKLKKISTEYLFFGSGTIDTAIHLMNYFKIYKLKFRHQPYFYGLLLRNSQKKINYVNTDNAILHYSVDKNLKFSGAFGLYNSRIIKYINNNFRIPLLFLKTFKKFIFNKSIFFNCFMSSRYNEISIKKKNNSYHLKSKLSKKNFRKKIKKFENYLLGQFFKNKKTFKIAKIVVPKIGTDKHFFGIKFKENNKIKLTNNCQIKSDKKIFLIDQSCIDIDTSKFITFLSLCNSFRLGKYFCNFLNKKINF